MNAEVISVPISLGELWDRHSILMIKKNKISDTEKLKYLNEELHYLEPICTKYQIDKSLYDNLLEINSKLWDIEDAIRKKEEKLSFDEEFISIARSVYKNNDIRASIKHKINATYNSLLREIKDY